MTITREQLAAYADGQLDELESGMIAAELAANPELQRQLTAHRALRARLAAHFDPVLDQPIPERLTAAVMDQAQAQTDAPVGAHLIDFAAAAQALKAIPKKRSDWAKLAGVAIAASLILALVGLGLRPSGNYAHGPLSDALDRQLAAELPAGSSVRILLSFRSRDGQFCRAYSSGDQAGIACRERRGWHLQDVGGAGPATSGEFRQAGSPAEAVMAKAQEIADGPALDAPAEAAAVRRGWR